MGGGTVFLLCLVAIESCWASSSPQALESSLENSLEGGDLAALRWRYAYPPAALFKRLPQYNFGLGKRTSASKLYSFGLGKRAVDYDEDTAAEDELSLSDDLLDADKRNRVYSFGLGKRAKPYSFGLGKRAKAYSFGLGKRGDRKLYSFGLGKRRYDFGLGKRSDLDSEDQGDADEYWQSSGSAIGKREVTPQELRDVDHQTDTAPDAPHSVLKRAASPLQYSFGLGKRSEDEDLLDLLAEDGLSRTARAGKQYGFGLGKRAAFRQYGAKRGPRQYGFGLGRRSMQYNFGIGKRSSTEAAAEAAAEATPSPLPSDR